MLRLDPAIPLIWISTETVQVGSQRAIARFAAEERYLKALTKLQRGVFEAELEVDLGDATADFLAHVRPALEQSSPTRTAVRVSGAHPVALELQRHLHQDARTRPPYGFAVPVAAWNLPDAERQRLLRRELPHLPIVIGDYSIEIGPLTVPGASACWRCAFLSRDTPATPSPTDAPPVSGAALATTVGLVFQTLGAWERGEAKAGRAWQLVRADGRLLRRDYAAHPSCGCTTDLMRALPAPRAA